MLAPEHFINATHWGIVRGQTRDGVITDIAPFELDRAPSPNIDRLIGHIYSDRRILSPMVREGFLRHGPESRADRGRDRLVPVSWEVALSLAAREIARVYDNYGPAAVFGRSYGWKSPGSIHVSVGLARRLMNLCGGFIACNNSYSSAAISSILPYVVGVRDPQSVSWELVHAKSELVVFWGADPIVTADIDWSSTLHEGRAYVLGLRDRQIDTIAINPVHPETAKVLSSRWIAPRQGTDTALMLAIMHTLDEAQLIDHDFLSRCTVGAQAVLEDVRGISDGVAKTAEWAAEITGVDAQTIRALAFEMKRRRTMIMMGWGPQRTRYGEQNPWMAYALACMLGHIGLPGGGIGTNYHYCDGGVPRCVGTTVEDVPARVPASRACAHPDALPEPLPVARVSDCWLHPGKTISYAGREVTYPEVRLVIWSGGNPFTHQPDTFRLRRAWTRPEAIIVADTVLTATARHADIVLPATTVFERNDITNISTYSGRGIVAMQQAIAPIGSARNDYDIMHDLADRLGIGQAFSEGMSADQRIEHHYNRARERARTKGVEMPDFETFWHQGYHIFERDPHALMADPWAAFRADPEGHRLDTPSGRIELESSRIAAMAYDDCPAHPSYLPPKQSASYPLTLMSIKTTRRLHSQLDESRWAHETRPEPCRIHPDDARARGIVEGDIVRIFNSRGATLARACISQDVRCGVITLPHGAWFYPDSVQDGLDCHGASNVLTPDVPTSQLSWGNIASGACVNVQKYTATKT